MWENDGPGFGAASGLSDGGAAKFVCRGRAGSVRMDEKKPPTGGAARFGDSARGAHTAHRARTRQAACATLFWFAASAVATRMSLRAALNAAALGSSPIATPSARTMRTSVMPKKPNTTFR